MEATSKGRKRRGRIAAALAVIAALTAGFFALAPSAYAHHPELSGTSQCQADGTFTVDWTIGNSESASNRYMLVRAYSVTPAVGTTNGLTADGSYAGIVGPSYAGAGTVVPPSGSVTATTTGIPADTTSVTLSVTGRWKYDDGGRTNEVTETRSYTVKLSGKCTPPTGSLAISKVVTGNSAPAGATYTVNYDDGAGHAGSVTVQGGETRTVTDLPYGTYTLSEVGAPAGATISPNPAVVGADEPNVAVTVTNPYPDLGGFSVTKKVTGAIGGYVPGSTFEVTYDCSNGAEGTLSLGNGDTGAVGNLPIGTQCTLAEGTKPATSGPSYVYGAESFAPSNVVTVTTNATDDVVQITLTNPLEQLLGSFSVTKHVTGATEGYVPGSTFTVGYACSNGTEGTLLLVDGAADTVNGLPVGTTCTLDEPQKPATSGPAHRYGTEVFTPSNTVTIGATADVAVTLTNPIELLTGGLDVTKDVTGATDGYVEGSTFGFALDCDGSAFDQPLTLAAGQTATVDGIPLGTSCTVTETSVPAAVPGYVYDTPVITPANGTVTIGSTTERVSVEVENPLRWLPDPGATIVDDCESGGAVVTLRNTGGGEVVYRILVDGEVFGSAHIVGSGDEQLVVVPLDEDQRATITVEAEGLGEVAREVVEHGCTNPAATFTVDCAEGGVVVTLTNDGDSPVELTVVNDGEAVDTVTVGAEPVDVVVPMDEDQTSTITVQDGDRTVGEEQVTYDCETPPTVPPEDTIPPASVTTVEVLGKTELPTTGSNVFGLVALAAGLILAGASLVGITRRRS